MTLQYLKAYSFYTSTLLLPPAMRFLSSKQNQPPNPQKYENKTLNILMCLELNASGSGYRVRGGSGTEADSRRCGNMAEFC